MFDSRFTDYKITKTPYGKDIVRDFDYYTPEICVPSGPLRVKGREVSWETCATIRS